MAKNSSARDKIEAGAAGAATGGAIGSLFGPALGALGAGLGSIAGVMIGDEKTVFPIDMVAIPAYQAYLLNSNPAFTIYIKAGETLVPTGGNVLDMQENMDVESAAEMSEAPKKRKRSKWNIYTSKKKNQIRFKSGKNKGLLNLKAMGKAYRKAQKEGKK